MSRNRKFLIVFLSAVAVLAVAGLAFAFINPTVATDPGFELWDLVVNKFIKGPLGTATGVVMLAAGAVGAAMGKLSGAVWPLVGGGALVTAPGLAVSLGMLF